MQRPKDQIEQEHDSHLWPAHEENAAHQHGLHLLMSMGGFAEDKYAQSGAGHEDDSDDRLVGDALILEPPE